MFNELQGCSAFLALKCQNPNCKMENARMVVERATMIVLFTNYLMVDGKPAWPSHWQNRKGEQILPKPGQVTGG